MKFEINLYIVLVFLVPGLIIMIAFVALIHQSKQFELLVEYSTNNKLDTILLILPVVFALGALVDSVKTVILDPIIGKLLKSKLPKNYLSKVNKDNLEVFNTFVEQTQVYYRLNSNVFLSVLVTISMLIVDNFKCPNWLLLLLAVIDVIFFIASVQSKKIVYYAMEQFCKSQK